MSFAQAQANFNPAVCRNRKAEMSRGLGAKPLRIDGIAFAEDNVIMNGILKITAGGLMIQTGQIGFVVAEQQLGVAVEITMVNAEVGLLDHESIVFGAG